MERRVSFDAVCLNGCK